MKIINSFTDDWCFNDKYHLIINNYNLLINHFVGYIFIMEYPQVAYFALANQYIFEIKSVQTRVGAIQSVLKNRSRFYHDFNILIL